MTLLLVLPLLCGLAFPLVAWLLKQGMERSRDPWGVLMVSNILTALPFVLLAATDGVPLLEGPGGGAGAPDAAFSGSWMTGAAWAFRSVPLPALLCGVFFAGGQIAGYLSFAKGDISLAIPLQGVKVILISLFALVFLGHSGEWNMWVAALLIPVALYFMREHPPGARETRKHRLTIVLALTAAACLAALDTGVQAWSDPASGGVARFGFWAFSFQAVLSAGLYFMPGRAERFRYPARAWAALLAGSFGMALITLGIVWVISQSGRAAWVNILFQSRVLWAAAFPLVYGLWRGTSAARQGGRRRILTGRLVGAVLMLASIALAVL